MQVGTLAVDPVVIWRCLRSSERAASLYFLYVSALAVILPLGEASSFLQATAIMVARRKKQRNFFIVSIFRNEGSSRWPRPKSGPPAAARFIV